MVHRWGALLLVLALAVPLAVARPAGAVVDLKFYYPVGVSGPLAKVMDEMVADFNRIHPGIHVTPVFAGGYYETMTKTQTAVLGGRLPTWRCCCPPTSSPCSTSTRSSRLIGSSRRPEGSGSGRTSSSPSG